MADRKPTVDFIPALTALPLATMLPFVNALLQNVSLRHIGETCYDFGLDPEIAFVPRATDPDEPEDPAHG